MDQSANTNLVHIGDQELGPCQFMAATLETAQSSEIDLSMLLFSAKIDYVTLQTSGKSKLPALSGKACWSPRLHYKALSIHDPTPADLIALKSALGPAIVLELEVAVDIRARPRVGLDDRLPLLRKIMTQVFAMRLDPSRAKGIRNEFRAFYRRLNSGYIVRPFNMRPPKPSDQLLYGGRSDDCQVKCYLKVIDQGKALKSKDHAARVEVRLSGQGLSLRGIQVLDDLGGFKFRKILMPFFSHIEGTERRKRLGKLSTEMRKGINAYRNKGDRELWSESGVGAFKNGGKGDASNVRLVRDAKINDRIGQALHRLEQQYAQMKFVCFEAKACDPTSYLTRDSDDLAKSPVTN